MANLIKNESISFYTFKQQPVSLTTHSRSMTHRKENMNRCYKKCSMLYKTMHYSLKRYLILQIPATHQRPDT